MTLRVGVVGMGFMGRTHAAAFQAARRAGHACELVAFADRSGIKGAAGNLDGGADAFDPSGLRQHNSAEAMFADADVDLVSLCTPTDTHADLAVAAMRAGKHVLVEKPVAIDLQQIERVAAVAGETGRTCMPAMCMRFWPAWKWLRDRMGDGEFGALQSLSLQRLGSRPDWSPFYHDASRSGGALFDLHVHDTDFVVASLGQPAAVTCVGTIDAMTTLYHYDHGVRVAAEGGWHHDGFGFRMRYIAVFEAATIDFDLLRTDPLLLCRNGEATPIELPQHTGYDGQVRALVDALAAGEPAPLSVDDALATHRVLLAEQRSLAARERVAL